MPQLSCASVCRTSGPHPSVGHTCHRVGLTEGGPPRVCAVNCTLLDCAALRARALSAAARRAAAAWVAAAAGVCSTTAEERTLGAFVRAERQCVACGSAPQVGIIKKLKVYRTEIGQCKVGALPAVPCKLIGIAPGCAS